jgi:hypothetical protein
MKTPLTEMFRYLSLLHFNNYVYIRLISFNSQTCFVRRLEAPRQLIFLRI